MDTTFTIADIARETKIPESTLRFYRNTFSEYIRTEGSGRTRRYHGDTVKVLTTVHQLFAENLDREQVEERLSQTFQHAHTVKSEAQQDRSKALALLTQGLMPLIETFAQSQRQLADAIEKQTEAFGKLATRFEESREHERKRSKKLLSMFREQKTELERQRRENEVLKRELHRPLSFWEIITGRRRISRPQQQPQQHASPNPQQPKTTTPAQG